MITAWISAAAFIPCILSKTYDSRCLVQRDGFGFTRFDTDIPDNALHYLRLLLIAETVNFRPFDEHKFEPK